MAARRTPSFIGIGAEKSATTWCWICLERDPRVFAGKQKKANDSKLRSQSGANWYASSSARGRRIVIARAAFDAQTIELPAPLGNRGRQLIAFSEVFGHGVIGDLRENALDLGNRRSMDLPRDNRRVRR